MGLDLYLLTSAGEPPFEPSHARWSYGGFARFRVRLAEAIGVNLDRMEGYCTDGISWATVDDPLVPLLNHSDCDGELRDYEIGGLADRIRAIVRLWPDGDRDRQEAERLASMLERAERLGGVVDFR